MKKLFSIGLLLVFISAYYNAFSQNKLLNEMTITPPSFRNEYYENLNVLLRASLEYPSSAIYDGFQGTEVIRFAISDAGEIEDFIVVNSVCEDIDSEVLRVLQNTNGKWDPGAIDGEPTTMVREISVVFALHSIQDMLETAQYYLKKANELMFIKNKPEKALYYYCKAASLFPNNESILIFRGYCFNQLGRTEEASNDWERVRFLANNYIKVASPESGTALTSNNFDRALIFIPE